MNEELLGCPCCCSQAGMMSYLPRSQRTRLLLDQPLRTWRNYSRISNVGGLFMLHRMGGCTTASERKPLYFKFKDGLNVVLGQIYCLSLTLEDFHQMDCMLYIMDLFCHVCRAGCRHQQSKNVSVAAHFQGHHFSNRFFCKCLLTIQNKNFLVIFFKFWDIEKSWSRNADKRG